MNTSQKCDLCHVSFRNLKKHKAYVHNVNVTWHKCGLCSASFKRAADVKRHKAYVHNVDVTWHKCNLCSASFKTAADVKRHKAYAHNVDVTWHKCDLCSASFKRAADVKQHKAYVHNVDVTWHKCDLCSVSFKSMIILREHQTYVHDLNVTWLKCELCDTMFKKNRDLTKHMEARHLAEFVARRKKQENRVAELLVSQGWTQLFSSDTLPSIGYFKREHRIDFECAQASVDRKYCRGDFVLGYHNGYVFLEVDEHQHRFGYNHGDNKAISCDSKRMANVHTSITIECSSQGVDVPFVYWLRYNPDAWHVDETLVHKERADRELFLLSFLSNLKLTRDVEIGYLFYDYSTEMGLDVLLADEFPDTLRNIVVNLAKLKDGLN